MSLPMVKLKIIFVIISSFLLTGSSYDHFALRFMADKDITRKQLLKEKKGVLVIDVNAVGYKCINVLMDFSMKNKSGELRSSSQQEGRSNVASFAHAKSRLQQIKINPGTYHLVSATCIRHGSYPTYTSTKNSIFGPYNTSFASFKIKAGEIVNVGVINLRIAKDKKVLVSINNISSQVRKEMKSERPLIYKQMKTRLMKITKNSKQFKK